MQIAKSPKPRASYGLVSRPSDNHMNYDPPWTGLGTNVSLGRHTPPGRSQSIAVRLIPMGVWRDLVRSRQNEKTGATRLCRK